MAPTALLGMVFSVFASSLAWASAELHRGSDEARTLRSFGAVGDNRTDDTAALQRAFDQSGDVCLNGEGLQFRVRGTLRVSRDFCLENARLRQDTRAFETRPFIAGNCAQVRDAEAIVACRDPAMSDTAANEAEKYLAARTLLIRPDEGGAAISVKLRNLKIDRGSDPMSGSRSDAAGIWIGNARRAELEGIEVTGAGKGYGIIIVNSHNVVARSLWLHDMTWAPYDGDDQLTVEGVRRVGWNSATIREFRKAGEQGARSTGFYGVRVQEQLTCLMIIGSSNVTIGHSRIDRCGAQFAEGVLPWQADGIAIGRSSSDINITGVSISDTWEGIDIVGGGNGVAGVEIAGSTIVNSFGYGVKWGYNVRNVAIRGSAVRYSGLAGVVIYGPVIGASLQGITITEVGSVRLMGKVERPWVQERAGVLVEQGSSAETRNLHPIGVSLESVTVDGGSNCRFGMLNLGSSQIIRSDIVVTGCLKGRHDQSTN